MKQKKSLGSSDNAPEWRGWWQSQFVSVWEDWNDVTVVITCFVCRCGSYIPVHLLQYLTLCYMLWKNCHNLFKCGSVENQIFYMVLVPLIIKDQPLIIGQIISWVGKGQACDVSCTCAHSVCPPCSSPFLLSPNYYK
jgi:hypothetical protein